MMLLCACLIALLANSIGFYYLVFAASALTVSLSQISRLPMIAELSTEEQRPTFIALANLISAPFIVGGIAGGWLVNRFGFEAIFAMGAGFALFSLLWLLLKVKEPRQPAGYDRGT
jgi:predicted MFS family arabinose efflux permease